MLSAGDLLDNRYRLDDRIATGGMGDVWRGTDVVLGRTVAVKVLRTAMLEDPEFATRFYGEARMMATFRHPGVVEVYDYASDGDYSGPEKVAYLVMAFVEGEPLSNRVKEGPIPVTETLSIVAQAADALHAAHQAGIVHRDIKPGNLIVKPTGAVILIDFGVARSNALTSVTGLNAIVGTALYMAPEQVAKGDLTPATDVYALGAVAYHCIAGHPPFDGENALQVALRHLEDEPPPLPDHVPFEVQQLIARAMAKQPADRFQSAAEFAEAAFAAAGPLDWKRLTGTSMVAPLSPAAPTRAVPRPRDFPPQMPVSPAPRQVPVAASRSSQPLAQRGLMIAILALFAVAGGLGLIFVLNQGDDKEPVTSPTQQNEQINEEVLPPPVSEEAEPSTEVTSRKPVKQRPRSASASPSPSLSSTSPSPAVSTTPPTTEPTTKAPTTPATTEPTTEPTITTTPPKEPEEPDPGTTTTTPTGAGGGATP
ncbi:putative serine/threonine protein kinase [Actinoplanes missouriensis 431]|uniref:non-specific serine/threonine protein kinase n=1 Tax=Actinoplanes missouriensis (strain ATCC 14538 / DSM 43046 / CBS 188.64 / JCM 3121 / NBRC 102363 / NCIMB 12654 / NRRL B-3342 / UNCC 431) TaxID=512565 RepID=I0H0H5_ACTM4|nr:serine/threonine-protein kinase [Actinoplanes missouriensis]BAL86512.1 putative serine/threonine protein kinase [Actinoplanes missouriensis 431]